MVFLDLLLQLSFFPLAQLDLFIQLIHLDVTLMSYCAQVPLDRVNVSVLELDVADKALNRLVFIYFKAAIALPVHLLNSPLNLPLSYRIIDLICHLSLIFY